MITVGHEDGPQLILSRDVGTGRFFDRRAIADGKPVLPLQDVVAHLAIFAAMPGSMVAGLYICLFGMIASCGLSQLQHVDLNSTRNLFILGLGLASDGAALATACAEYLGLGIAVIAVRRARVPLPPGALRAAVGPTTARSARAPTPRMASSSNWRCITGLD